MPPIHCYRILNKHKSAETVKVKALKALENPLKYCYICTKYIMKQKFLNHDCGKSNRFLENYCFPSLQAIIHIIWWQSLLQIQVSLDDL